MRRIFLGLSLAVFATPSFAQQTLADLVNASISNYPALKAQAIQISLNEQRTDLARTNWLPTINADAYFRLIGPVAKFSIPTGPNSSQEVTFQPLENWSAQVGVSQPLYDFGKINAGIAKSVAELQYSKESVSAQEATLAYHVAQLYYSIVYLERSLDISKAQIKQLEDTKALLEVQVKNGVALDYDVLSVQVRLNNAINQRTDVEGSLRKQIILLNNLTGNTGDYKAPADAAFLSAVSEADMASILDNADKGNWDIKLLNSKIKIAEQDVTIAQKASKPLLAANASLGVRNGLQPDVHLPRPAFMLGVSFSAPIYAGGRYKIQQKIADLGVIAARQQIDITQHNIKRDVEVALNDIRTTREKLKTFDTQIEQASMALDLAKARYRLGVIRNLELLDAETNFTLTQLTSLQYNYQLSIAILELQRLQGVRFW